MNKQLISALKDSKPDFDVLEKQVLKNIEHLKNDKHLRAEARNFLVAKASVDYWLSLCPEIRQHIPERDNGYSFKQEPAGLTVYKNNLPFISYNGIIYYMDEGPILLDVNSGSLKGKVKDLREFFIRSEEVFGIRQMDVVLFYNAYLTDPKDLKYITQEHPSVHPIQWDYHEKFFPQNFPFAYRKKQKRFPKKRHVFKQKQLSFYR